MLTGGFGLGIDEPAGLSRRAISSTDRPFGWPGPNRGASLIELLVVLFIIGMLMSLLMPALHRARLRADETVCDNNLRQLRMGLSIYRLQETLPGTQSMDGRSIALDRAATPRRHHERRLHRGG